jgi:hypothetical protein
MPTYQFTAGSRLTGDPQIVGEFLRQLWVAHDHQLTVPIIIDAGQPKRSPIHSYFEWNDARAANLHREEQARHLIRSIDVVVKTDDDGRPTETIRAFVHVVEERNDVVESVYVMTDYAQARPVLYQQVLAQALRDLEAFQRKYEQYEALAHIGQRARAALSALIEESSSVVR